MEEVISLPASGTDSGTVVYTANSGLLVPQVDSGNLVAASNAQHCETGQHCTLLTDSQDNNYLTDAVTGEEGFIECLNKTGSLADIGIGFYNDKGDEVEPAFVWNNVAYLDTLKVKLTPTLKIYAVSDYKESELLRADIESPILWERDLITLKSSTRWNVYIKEGTGQVIIEEA